ncbi:hypothetical protein Ancab_029724, partial [Ancistrocladus abbreviatus]
GDIEIEIGKSKARQGSGTHMCSPGISYTDIVKRPHIHDRQNQEGNRRGDQFNAELRMAALDDYDVRPMGGRLMLIRAPGEVNLANMESGLVGKLARWFDTVHVWSKLDSGGELVVIKAATKARTQLDVARFAVLTPVLHYISLTVRLAVDEDKFPIFITEEGRAICEKVGSIVYASMGSSEDSSEALFSLLALLSMVPESVGDDFAAGKLSAIALPQEYNTKLQNPLLAINDLADVIREEPLRNDGFESGKTEWRWKFRDDKDRMDGGETSIIEGVEVENSRLDMDPNNADLGDPETLWAATEKALGLPADSQLQLDNRRDGSISIGPCFLFGPKDKVGEQLLVEPTPNKPPGAAPTSIYSQPKVAKLQGRRTRKKMMKEILQLHLSKKGTRSYKKKKKYVRVKHGKDGSGHEIGRISSGESVRGSQIQNRNRILRDNLHKLELGAPITSSTHIWEFLSQLGI